jgi:hypothetical protein
VSVESFIIAARVAARIGAAFVLICACPLGARGQLLPRGSALGHEEPGAKALVGYLVQDRPCLPLKRFTADAGYRSNVSPSRRSFAVLVGPKTSLVLNRTVGQVDGRSFQLSVPAFERDGDFFVPLEFFEKAFPARFTFDRKRRSVTAVLPATTLGGKTSPGKTLVVPIRRLPAAPAH